MTGIKQGNRYHDILNTLCKHGFGYLASQIREGRVLSWCYVKSPEPQRDHESWSLPVRIRLAFEDLGPTFVKLGQLLSCRPDLIPPEFIQEFAKLQDNVSPLDFEQVRRQFLTHLGAEPDQLFTHFREQPIASASIGQVHLAVLPCGQEVAVKVQRPDIRDTIQKDMAILKRVSKILQDRTILGRVCNVIEIIESFERYITRELDFSVEGLNTEHFNRIFSSLPQVKVPEIYWQYSGEQILTTTYIPGNRLDGSLGELTITARQAIADNVMQAILYPFFSEGIFHGDPHAGNILLADDGTIVLLDFGIVGRVEPEFRRQVAQLLLALWSRDVQGVMNLTLEMGEISEKINEQNFFEDTAELVEKTLVIGQGDISFGEIIQGVIKISIHHKIKMQTSFLLLGKAILMGEGLACGIYPGFNILNVTRPLAMKFFREDLLPDVSPEGMYREFTAWRKIGSTIPRDLADIVRKTAKGELKLIFYHRNLQWMYDMLEVTSSRIAFSVVIAAMIIGSALVMHTEKGPALFGFPLFGLVGFIFSALMGGWVAVVLLRNIR